MTSVPSDAATARLVASVFKAVALDYSMPFDAPWPSTPWGDSARSEFRSRLTQRAIGTPEQRDTWIRGLTGGVGSST